MGQLFYGCTPTYIELDDRVLAHVQLVVTSKLRREEKFTLSWPDGEGGHSTIWLHPSIPLRFVFVDNTTIVLNHQWMEALMVAANSNGGLRIVPEPVPQLA
jgi:hypothetical protein